MEKNKITELVIRAQQGDQVAMNDLIGQCYDRLYASAYQTVKNPDTACDVTQEACLEIINSLQKLENPGAFMVWAQRITYHQCTRYFRQNKEVLVEKNEDGETIFDVLPDQSEGGQVDQAYETKEFRQEMMGILDTLPPEQRSALLLYYYEQLSVKQIAQIQDTTEGTVKSRLNYGRKAVKKQVEDYEKRNNIKLHSVAPLGLLLWWLFGREKDAAGITLQAMPKVAQALGAAGQTATAGASSAGAAAASVALPKVIAGGVAAVMATGAVVGGTVLLTQSDPSPEPTRSTVASTPAPHIHVFDGVWEYDESRHWRLCGCGEAEEAEHRFAEKQCLCGRYQPSEGLSFHTYDGAAYVYRMSLCQDAIVVIPENQDGYPVVGIEARAFWQDTQIVKAVLPGSLQEFGNHIFAYSSIREAVFLPGVRQLGESMFYNCTQLTTVTIPATVEYIPEGVFYDCTALEKIYFGGTMAQWRAIMQESGGYSVFCSDGVISGVA